MRIPLYLIALVLLAVSSPAAAWGPVTHAYLAARITGSEDPAVLYGSMLPDCNGGLLYNKPANSALKHLTHYEFDRLAPSAMATGFTTHNGAWGTDRYAHIYYDTSAPEIYSTRKMKALCSEFGFTMQDAENVFEGVIEYFIRIDQGAALVEKAAKAAEAAAFEEAMIAAYAQPMTERVAGMTLEQAQAEVRKAVQGFRVVNKMYTEELARRSDNDVRKYLPMALAPAMKCDTATCDRYITRCIDLCRKDYQAEMDRIVGEVRAKMESLPRHAPFMVHKGD
ncbi:MAG TPA: hypothetical protein PLO37_00435 [Candidatus Hydrogenedentes bacterium]|nr:hypothetical protein [Candidatus Hydrogenedentota bacterium]HPG65280.1 hypothetical protein [Candidatus Hydrogenedentota bacterium]